MLKPALNVALVIILVLCLLAATLLFGGVLLEYALPMFALVVLLGLLWTIKLLVCRDVSGLWSAAHLPVVLFAGYTAWRYAVSPIEYESRIELLHVACYMLVYFLVACNFYRTRDRLLLVGALALLALGEAIYGFWQYRRHVDVVLWLERGETYHGRASGSYFCPNHLAGLLEMALCLLVAHLLVNRNPHGTLQSALLTKLYEGVTVLFVAAGLFATLSRGGWVAAAVAMLVLLLWAERARALSSRFAITVFLGLVLLGAAAWSVPKVRFRIEQDIHVQLDYVPGDAPIHVVEGVGGRYPIWQGTLRIIRDHLWLGTGPRTWQWVHLKYREPRLQIRPQFAHSDMLQLASDYGLVGVLLVLAILACFYRQAWKLSCQTESAERRAFGLGAGAAVTAIIVHSLGDFNLHIPSNALWLVTIIGLTIGQNVDEANHRRQRMQPAGKVVLGLMVLVATAGIGVAAVKLCFGTRYAAVGYDASQRFAWDEAAVAYQRALRFDARSPETFVQIGDAYRMQSAVAEDPDEQDERRYFARLSVDAYRQSVSLNPYQSEVMLRLAAAYELAGDYPNAVRTYEEALAVDPNNAFCWLRVGMFYRRRGETALAIQALKLSERLNHVEPIAQSYLKEIQDELAGKP